MYPRLCCNVLKIHAGKIGMSAKVLAQTALDIALEFTKQTHITAKGYSEIKALNPVVTSAMRDCVEELNVAVQMLQKSKVELGMVIEGSTSGLHVSNVQTWVSAALTNLNTCKDGFVDHNLNGTVEKITARKIVKAAHLTSNALALINLCVSTKVTLP
ncbi:pectinesterase inhibitor 11-like [Rosa rugosa]|uniref:pectinesterase inhibitor 11-like n=1 Tax=Rosa rugosa TaxID=74645 RepID=UPI002B4147D2|nr:pectinesterase inhibitor 11-like [Rosa rugosa]